MASLIEELITALKEETVEYEALLELSTEKTGIIVKDDIKSLNEMIAKEQSHLDKIANLEKKRIEVMQDIAIVLNKDVNTLTVKGISELLEGQKEEQQELSQTRDRLKKLLGRVEAINEMNKGLIEEALDMINFDINYINGLSQLPETANYTKDAYNQNQMGLSTFDAKN